MHTKKIVLLLRHTFLISLKALGTPTFLSRSKQKPVEYLVSKITRYFFYFVLKYFLPLRK